MAVILACNSFTSWLLLWMLFSSCISTELASCLRHSGRSVEPTEGVLWRPWGTPVATYSLSFLMMVVLLALRSSSRRLFRSETCCSSWNHAGKEVTKLAYKWITKEEVGGLEPGSEGDGKCILQEAREELAPGRKREFLFTPRNLVPRTSPHIPSHLSCPERGSARERKGSPWPLICMPIYPANRGLFILSLLFPY